MKTLKYKRQEKRLLIGLGSTIGFGSTALLGGFGIVNLVQNHQATSARLALDSVDNIPGFNTVKVQDGLFHDTKNFTRFHFGNTWRGQTVTPLGWLGVKDDEPNNLYLTGWNGEILWKYNFTSSGDKRPSPVYDLKYDWNTNLIFILSSPYKEGLFINSVGGAFLNIQLQVINAANGEVISAMNGINTFRTFKALSESAFELFSKQRIFGNVPARWEHLYYGDVASQTGNKDNVYYTYLPNFLQLSESPDSIGTARPDRATRDLPSFETVLRHWNRLIKTFQIKSGKFQEVSFNDFSKNTSSDGIWIEGNSFKFAITGTGGQITKESAEQFSLVTNPFTTVGAMHNTLIYHFIIANQEASKVYHVAFANYNTLGSNSKNQFTRIEDVSKWVQPKFDKAKSYNWAKASDWDTKLILAANTRVQHNMFDPNSVVFAYPYTASTENNLKIPAFNVAQLYINSQDGTVANSAITDNNRVVPKAIQTTKYEIGKQVLSEYEKSAASSEMIMEPWPREHGEVNANLKYNRLISVSPFDNTIIFAAPNPFRKSASINTSHAKDKFASFWLGTNQIKAVPGSGDAGKDNGSIRPFLISNSNISQFDFKPLDPRMVDNLDNFYKEGFTFDLASLTFQGVTSSANNEALKRAKPNINLYFNQSGREKNSLFTYEITNVGKRQAKIKSSKIGLLDDPFTTGVSNGNENNNNGWTSYANALYGNVNDIRKVRANISNDSFVNLITSRADLNKWYVKSAFNFTPQAANTLQGNTSLTPTYSSTRRPAVMYGYDQKLSYRDQDSLNLFANWFNGSANGKGASNFDRLLVKNSTITVANESIENKLKVNWQFANPTQLYDRKRAGKYAAYMYGGGSGGSVDHNRYDRQFTFLRPVVIANPSVELFNSWAVHGYVEDIGEFGKEPDVTNLSIFTQIGTSGNYQWADARKRNAAFGKVNNANNVAFDSNTSLLRTVFRIKKPAKAPAWMNNIPAYFFDWHPTKSSDLIGNEQTFASILKNYPKELAKNISLDYGATKTSAAGLANLTIEAGLQLNPKAPSNQKLYALDNGYQAMYNPKNGNPDQPLFVIYKDQYSGNREVYKQNQTTREALSRGGFGEAVYNDLIPSWTIRHGNQTTFENLTWHKTNADRIVIPVNVADLTNDKVRQNQNDKNPIITARYIDNTKRQIRIEFAGDSARKNWFNNAFSMYNFALNMYAQFEYTTKAKPKEWTPFSITTETDVIKKTTDNGNKIIDHNNAANQSYVFDTTSTDIIQVRFRLKPFETHDAPKGEQSKNDFIRWLDWTAQKDSDKLISTPARVAANIVKFEQAWISTTELGTAQLTWNSLTSTTFEQYEAQIEQKVLTAPANQAGQSLIKGKLKFEYQFNGGSDNQWRDHNQLLSYIQGLLSNYSASDGGVFAIGDGQTTGKYSVTLRVSIQDGFRDEFVLEEGNQIKPEGVAATVKSLVKTTVDLNSYFVWLRGQSLIATMGATPGHIQANSIQIPDTTLTNGAQFHGKTFSQMKELLGRMGIKFQFQEWNNQTNSWSSTWIEDLATIVTYNPKEPKIKIGLKVEGAQNIKVLVPSGNANGSQEVSAANPWAAGVEVKLQLPIAISFAIEQVKAKFQAKQPIQGNTFELQTSGITNFEHQAKTIIAAANNGANDLKDRLLFEYKLEHSSWSQITDLVSWAKEQNKTRDILSNELQLRVLLINNEDHKYQVATNEVTHTTVYDDKAADNPLQIYINGFKLEEEIKQVALGGDADAIEYNWPPTIKNLVEQGQPEYLTLEWAPITNETAIDQWVDHDKQSLPTDSHTYKAIKIRIGIKATAVSTYVYGPEQAHTRVEQKIDFAQLKQLVMVDPTWFQQVAIVDAATQIEALTATHITDWERKIKQKINQDAALSEQIEIKYDFANASNLNAAQVVAKLHEVAQAPNPEHRVGFVLQLWDGQSSTLTQGHFSQVRARFGLKAGVTNVELKDNAGNVITNDAAKLTGVANTQNIYTTVDLTDVVRAFANVGVNPSVRFDDDPNDDYLPIEGLVPPQQIVSSTFYKNQTWKTIEADLALRKINLVFSPDNGASWNRAETVDKYNAQTLQMWLAINNQSSNLNVKITTKSSSQTNIVVVPNDDSKTRPISIGIQAPKLVVIQDQWLDAFKQNPGFSGNTKYLMVTKDKIDNLIANIKQELAKINPDLGQVPLEAVFSLGNNTSFKPAAALAGELERASQDQTSRIINFKLQFKSGADTTDWLLRGAAVDHAIALTHENEHNPLKIFLHDDGLFAALNSVKLSGGKNDNSIQWNFENGLEINPVSGIITQPNKQLALVVEYNDQSAAPNDGNWTRLQPQTISSSQTQIWIRLNWASDSHQLKYDLEDATARGSRPTLINRKSTFNSNIKKAIRIDLTNIKRTVNLQTEWLKQVRATGNLVNLEIDETSVQKLIDSTLPNGEAGNITLEYSIGVRNSANNAAPIWMSSAMLINFLKTNQGRGANGFILRREEIKIRFALKQGLDPNKYGWNIDGKPITTVSAYQKHYQQLIDDNQGQNGNVMGIINLSFVPGFNSTNFAISGTNNSPTLKIINDNEMTAQLSPYASDQIFKIQLTTDYDEQNHWNWSTAIDIFQAGQFVTNLSGLTIKPNRKAAIRLIVSDATGSWQRSKYELIGSQKQTNPAVPGAKHQLLLDISENINIVTEIINPFSQAAKALAIQIRDDNNKAQWEQGQGQFRIVVGNLNGIAEPNKQSAQVFLDKAALPDEQKAKLEFVYQIFDTKPTQEQITAAKTSAEINNPKGNWQVFDFKGNDDWTNGLKLKVGQFIMVALRVKLEYQNGANAYALKNEDHSVLIPVNYGSTANEISIREPGRVSGLLIDPNKTSINPGAIRLQAMDKTLTTHFLDGWTQLDGLTIDNPDQQADGIELQINLFSDFYVDSNNQVLVSASKAKLIKRDSTNATQGEQYVDTAGNPMVDAHNKPIYQWIDKTTKRLAKPLELQSPSRTLQFLNKGGGRFDLVADPAERDFFSLFKNQRIDIVYQAKVGLGTAMLPDFVLTTSKTENIQDLVSRQIKFPISNAQNIQYRWNFEEFRPELLQYEATDAAAQPAEGFARLITPLSIFKTAANGTETKITGNNAPAARAALEKMLSQDFDGQLKFQFEYRQVDGRTTTFDGLNLQTLTSLHNGDQITIRIVATDPDLAFIEEPLPLVLEIQGLVAVAPTRDRLQYLRVEQNGLVNGAGSFKILLNKPGTEAVDSATLLNGWKFMIRVWSPTGIIKKNWVATDYVDKLSNGDKVEWKLVDAAGNPVQDAYYNTIAGPHQVNDGGQVELRFREVQFSNGPDSMVVVNESIGEYPDPENENAYPQTSGFVIGGLQERLARFDLTQLAFEKIIATLSPRYKGRNGHGVLNFAERFFQGHWWVNHAGEVYQAPANYSAGLQADDPEQPAAITLEQFLAHTTFYSANPATTPGQLGWQFSSNATAIDNNLSNGDQLWARFDVAQPIEAQSTNTLNSNSKASPQTAGYSQGFLIADLPPVNNLTQIPDPMSPLWWTLVALGAVLTLGGLAVFLWKQRHKKLKIPKF